MKYFIQHIMLAIRHVYMVRHIMTALFFLLLLWNVSVFGQNEQVKPALEAIAKYTQVGSDRTNMVLFEIGFVPPEHLKSQWNAFPAVRKIETAYFAAEVGSRQRMLALLSRKLAQQYESVRYERALAPYFSDKYSEEKISFEPLNTFEMAPSQPVSENLREAIEALTKYSDSRALGGVRGILKYHFGLPDQEVYNILRSSINNFDALVKGIGKAAIPPTQKERLVRIVKDLQTVYEGARTDAALNRINKVTSSYKMPGGKSLQGKKELTASYLEYKGYVDHHFSQQKLKTFESMSQDTKSIGGILFGNELISGSSVTGKRLKYIRWLSDPSEGEGYSGKSGLLEFEFSDNTVKVVTGVLLEDIYAAYQIVYTLSPFQYHENYGIGLASSEPIITDLIGLKKRAILSNNLDLLDYLKNYYWSSINDSLQGYNVDKLNKCILHPAIANLELGRSLMRCDVWLRTCGLLKQLIAKNGLTELQSKVLSAWLIGCNKNGWKFMDAPLTINSDKYFMNVTPSGSAYKSSYIMFVYQTPNDKAYQEFPSFNSIVPLLCNKIYDFNRLNQFAKILALVRWASLQQAIFLNKPALPPLVQRPVANLAEENNPIRFFNSVSEIKKYTAIGQRPQP